MQNNNKLKTKKRIKVNHGDKYGALTVISEIEGHLLPSGEIKRKIKCQCVCGEEKIVFLYRLVKLNSTNICKCQAREDAKQIGKKYGRLEIIKIIRQKNKNINSHYAICKCDCGNIKNTQLNYLKNGNVKSCGCLKNKIRGSIKNISNIAFSKTYEYRTFLAIKDRCNNTKNPGYENYGGRGIECRFKNFDDFFNEVGEKPSAKHSIDRINNDSHYEKGNVRWATINEQNNNTRSNNKISYNGKTQNLTEWARELGINDRTLITRITVRKWPIEKALTQKIQKQLHTNLAHDQSQTGTDAQAKNPKQDLIQEPKAPYTVRRLEVVQ